MEIQKIIQQLLKDSQPEDILDESDDKIESLTPIIKVSTGASVALEPENSFYVETAGVIPTLIVSEELYPFYLDLDPDEFVARLNKTLYEYVNRQLVKDRNRNVPDNHNIWMEPNAAFVNWFHEKGIDLDSQSSFITNDNKVEKNVGGRPKGLTKRTRNRYIKVYHQYTILKKKFPAEKKTDIYDLCSTKDYDGTTYSRKTIRNIIEEKKYNLKPSR